MAKDLKKRIKRIFVFFVILFLIFIIVFAFKYYKDYQQSEKTIKFYGAFLHDEKETLLGAYTDKDECEYDVKLYNALAKINFLDQKEQWSLEQPYPEAECDVYTGKSKEPLLTYAKEPFKKQIFSMKELTSHLQELLMYPADHLFDENEPIIWTDEKILDWASMMDNELIKGKKYIIFSYDEKLKDNESSGYSKLETSREVIRGFKTEQECKRVLNQEKKDNEDIDLFCIQVDALTLKDKENKNASEKWELVLATISKEEAENYKAYADTLGVTDNSSKIKNFDAEQIYGQYSSLDDCETAANGVGGKLHLIKIEFPVKKICREKNTKREEFFGLIT